MAMARRARVASLSVSAGCCCGARPSASRLWWVVAAEAEADASAVCAPCAPATGGGGCGVGQSARQGDGY
jgi:hypothetical protein